MSRKRVEDVDIFQRTLCCNPISLKEPEIEIFSSETSEVEEEEEEKIIEEEEPIDINKLLKEMECMKRRIQFMQLRLKIDVDECPEEKCMDYEVLLRCSKHKEICSLQKNQHMLQCQIRDLIGCCKVTKEQIQDLNLQMCEKSNEICKLTESVKELMFWKNTLEHEFGKCLERFEYLKHVKAEWQDLNDQLEKQELCLETLKGKLVFNEIYEREKKSINDAVNDIKQKSKELLHQQNERAFNFEEHFGSLEQRLATLEENLHKDLKAPESAVRLNQLK